MERREVRRVLLAAARPTGDVDERHCERRVTMRKGPMTAIVAAVVLCLALLTAISAGEEAEQEKMAEQEKTAEKEDTKEKPEEMAFGGKKDVAFANALWTALEGHEDWIMQSEIMPGKSPHGAFVRMYYSIVTIDGQAYHVVNKDNYGGEGVTLEMVKENPATYLVALTPMVQREHGYDPDNNDWFWVKFNDDGSIGTTPDGKAIAGRFAKGMPMGCISCHANAGGGDYLFAND
jgi:hypothetical protein